MGARDTEVVSEHEGNAVLAAIGAGELLERYRSTPKYALGYLHAKPFLILRDADGKERVEYVDGQKEKPTFRKGVVHLLDGTSFIAYFNHHGSEDSAIYATMNPCKFVGVLDEHPGSDADEPPEWRQFRVEFQPALSKEWAVWTEKNGSRNGFESTEAFAYFVEDNAPDFVEPAAASMLEMALNFRATQSVQYKAVQRLADGNVELQYSNVVEGETTARGGSVRIPETFTIRIPVFAGPAEEPRDIEARLRYRVQGGGVRLWYELVRPHKVLEEAFKDLFINIGEGTKRDVLLGVTD